MSQQIASLERITGTRLVERPGGPKPVSLTEAGELLRGHAHALVARLAAARADFEALGEGTAGRLRVGIYQSVGARVLPEVLRRFAAAWPRVDVRLTEAVDDEELLRLVERGELELAFMSGAVGDGPFATRLLLRDPLVVLVEASSRLGQRGEPVSLDELARLPLIAYSHRLTGDLIESRLRARGVEPRIVLRSDDHGTIHGLVAAGVGAALLPRLGVDTSRDDVRVLPLSTRLAPRLVGIAWHRDRYRSAATDAFVETAAAVCAELDADLQAR